MYDTSSSFFNLFITISPIFLLSIFGWFNEFTSFSTSNINLDISKSFDDGRNIHLCLKTQEEWEKIFLEFKAKYPQINQYLYFNN